MSDLWRLGVPVAEKVVRIVLVYGGLAVLLRVAGKRNLAQLNSFDLVVVLLLSNVVQNAIIGPDNSLTGGLLGAEVTLSPGGSIVVWLKPGQMNATRTDLAAIGTRLDAIERALGRR
jgi:hypothetical protein